MKASEPLQALSGSHDPSPAARQRWIEGGLVLLILLAYAQVAGFEFLDYDDTIYLTRNPVIQGGLSWKALAYAFTSLEDGSYLPLVWLSHALSSTIFGTWAGGHHLVNVVLHAMNAVLVYRFFRDLTDSWKQGATVALLFALHPLHVESVAWVAERKDVLSTLFLLMTLSAYVKYVRGPSKIRFYGVMGWFSLGLLSKSMLVTVPLILLLLDFWPLGRWRKGARWGLFIEKIPLIGLAALCGALTLLAQQQVGALAAKGSLPMLTKVGNAVLAVMEYLRLTFWPLHLSPFYPHPGVDLPWMKVWVGLGILAIVTLGCLWQRARRPFLLMGWIWFLLTLLPVLGLLQVGAQGHADRYTYVPHLGLFLLLGGLLVEALQWVKLPRVVLLALGAGMLAVLLVLTTVQVSVWKDNTTLFRHALLQNPRNGMAYLHLGKAYLAEGNLEPASVAYLKATQHWPGNYRGHFKLGEVLELMGRNEQALLYYRNAKLLAPWEYAVDAKLGALLVHLGLFMEAEPFVRRVLDHPEDFQMKHQGLLSGARVDWALILRAKGDRTAAILELNRLLEQEPNHVRALVELGLTWEQAGNAQKAMMCLGQALALAPRHPQVLYSQAKLLGSMGRREDAQRVLTRLEAIEPGSKRVSHLRNQLAQAQASQAKSVAK